MILTIDIGNSNIVLSVYSDSKWFHTFRYETKGVKQELYYETALRQIFMEWGLSTQDIRYAVISSVVPDLNLAVREAIGMVAACPILLLGPEVYKKLDINVPHPYEIGSDLVANAYAALHLMAEKVIVVDFGTALSFVIANEKEGVIGVTIAPGLKTAAQSLSDQTAQLPLVPLEYPESVIGHDTLSAIQAGIMYGFTGLCKEIIARMKSEAGDDYKVIITGGHAALVERMHDFADFVEKNLTLDGIRLISAYMANHYPEDFTNYHG
jgi:type III pantothenate kinase